jgi:uncharacterized protein (DUF1330 family)
MVAYVIAEIDVHDPAAYEEYKAAASASIARYGGSYRVRGGAAEALEGDAPKRLVVLEFASLDAAKQWYHSADYQAAVKLRQKCSTGRLVLLEGL